MRRSVVLSISIIAALLAPSAALAQSSPTGEVLSLGGRVEVPEAGFAVTLPDGWVSLRPSRDDIGVILDEVEAQLPELGQTIEVALGSGLAFSLLALDSGSDPTFTQNCNVLDRPADGLTIDAVGADELGKLAAFADIIIDGPELTFVELPSGRAARLDLGLRLPAFDTASTSYVFIDETWVHTMTCTDLVRPDDGWLSIAESIELLPAAD